MLKTSVSDLYQHVRRRLDVRQVLDYYGAENVSESTGKDGGTWIVHSCLLDRVEPHHSNGDRNPSAWVNAENGTYVCASYWTGSLFHLIQKLEGSEELQDIMPVVGNLLAGRKDLPGLKQDIEKLFAEDVFSVEIPTYSKDVLKPWLKTHPYMIERGISHETCAHLGIGYDERENRIVFPHYWEGKLVGWQKRAIPEPKIMSSGYQWSPTNPQFPKYRNSPGFPKSETLYQYDFARPWRRVIVVESPMSVARSVQFLMDIPVVATFGAKVSKTQIRLLEHFDHVTVWFDADPAGNAGERKIVENLWRHTNVSIVQPDEGKDLADYTTRDEIEEKIRAARSSLLWLQEHKEVR